MLKSLFFRRRNYKIFIYMCKRKKFACMGYNGRPERYYKFFKVISCTGSTSLSEKAARDQCGHVQIEGS
jgi:hypothetical protein